MHSIKLNKSKSIKHFSKRKLSTLRNKNKYFSKNKTPKLRNKNKSRLRKKNRVKYISHGGASYLSNLYSYAPKISNFPTVSNYLPNITGLLGNTNLLGYGITYEPANATERSQITSATITDKMGYILKSIAFNNCTSLTNVIIPNYIHTIGPGAFAGCSALTNINLSENVYSIGRQAFEGCTSLTEINLPNDITIIKPYTFKDCTSLKNVNISTNNTFIIEYGAFINCSALEINIPKNVISIKEQAFLGCSSLKTVTIPHGIKIINSDVFTNCINLYEIILPNTIDTINSDAFSNCKSLRKLIFNKPTKFIIKEYAFRGANLNNINIINGTSMMTVNEHYTLQLQPDYITIGKRMSRAMNRIPGGY